MTMNKEDRNQQLRDERREEILQAALGVFACKGFVATKISDIARKAGMSHGLVYHYFKSKDEIFTELVARAFEVSLGTIAYAAQSAGDPLERIRLMSETILSGAFEGEGPFYFLMIIQAFTSDSTPPAVKDLTAEKAPLYQEYLIPLVLAGQKTGQIAAGDPMAMVTAYFSLIQGLAVIKMQGGEGMPLPDAEILLRLFQEPTKPPLAINKTVSGGNREKPLFGLIQVDPAWLIYRSRVKGAEEAEIIRTLISLETKDNQSRYRIVEENDTKDEKTVITARAEDWRPISVQVLDKEEKQIATVEYQNDTATFLIPERKLSKTIKLKGDYFDINMLSNLFQAYPFGQQDRIQFYLVMDGRGGSPVGSFAMYVKEIGRETLSVPAGEYDCYQLEMGISGMVGAFAAKHKYYFWYRAQAPYILVKYADQQGRTSELVGRIQA